MYQLELELLKKNSPDLKLKQLLGIRIQISRSRLCLSRLFPQYDKMHFLIYTILFSFPILIKFL